MGAPLSIAPSPGSWSCVGRGPGLAAGVLEILTGRSEKGSHDFNNRCLDQSSISLGADQVNIWLRKKI